MRNKRAARKRVSIEFDAEPSTWNTQYDNRVDHVAPTVPVPERRKLDVVAVEADPYSWNNREDRIDDVSLTLPKKRNLGAVAVRAEPSSSNRVDDVSPAVAHEKKKLDFVAVGAEPSTSNKIDDVSRTVALKKRKLDLAVQPVQVIREVDLRDERLIVPKKNWNTKQKINLYSKTRVIELINEKLTEKQKAMFRKGCFGHLLDFKIKKFPSQLIHHLILRQCPHAKPNELWFDIEGMIVKFRMKEFALITGLNCNKVPFIFKKNLPESTTKRKFFKKANSVPRKTLNDVFRAYKGGKDEEVVRLAKLYCLESLLIPKKVENNIDPYHLKMVDDPELFDSYPWGRLSYEMTMEYIKRSINSQQAEAYGIGGFPYAVIVWAYETIPTLIKKNYAKKIQNGIPRIINWEADQQPSFREITDRVFDSLELEVCHVVPTKEEMEQPFMAPFVKENKKEVNGVEEEKEEQEENEEESDYEDNIPIPTPIRQVQRNENEGGVNQAIKSLVSKVERMEKTQLEMKKDMEEIYSMLLEIHSAVVDQPSYFVGKYSNKEQVHVEENNDKIIEDRNQKMRENNNEKNDEQKDATEKTDEHSEKIIDNANEKREGKDSGSNDGQKDDTRMESEKGNEKFNEDKDEKMEDQESEANGEHKDDTGKEVEECNEKVIEDGNRKVENKAGEKNSEQKDDTGKEDGQNDKVIHQVNEKMENKDSEKHGEQKENTWIEGRKHNEKVNGGGNEKVEDKENS